MLKFLFISVLALSASNVSTAAAPCNSSDFACMHNIMNNKQRGDIITLNRPNINDGDFYVVISTTTEEPAGKLIFSDSPEQVSESGILYRENDIPKGKPVRVFVYHANRNDGQVSRKFLVVLENTADVRATVKVTAKAIEMGSARNCVAVGKAAVYAWLESWSKSHTPVNTLYLDRREFALLDPGLNKPVPPGSMLNAIIDFNATEKLRLSIISVVSSAVPSAPTVKSQLLKSLLFPLGPKSLKVVAPVREHERGTFAVVDRMLTGKLIWQKNKNGEFLASHIELAGTGQNLEKGIDSTCQRPDIITKEHIGLKGGVLKGGVDLSCKERNGGLKWKIGSNGQRQGIHLKGSYGVAYHVRIIIPEQENAPRFFCAVLRAGGGAYGGAGLASPAGDDEKKIKVSYLPSLLINAVKSKSDGIFIGKWTFDRLPYSSDPKDPKNSKVITFDWMPPGGSNLPVNLIFAPLPSIDKIR